MASRANNIAAPSNRPQVSSRREYKNPPITEAVCEFHFSPADEWNLAYTGLFLERVKERYGGKPREQRLLQVLNQPQPADAPVASFREITKVQFPTEDGREMIGVGPGTLSVHVMKPYSGWQRFKPQIQDALSVYLDIAKPKAVRRVGIRYINLLEGRNPGFKPGEYFFLPVVPLDDLGSRLDTFALRYEYVFSDEPVKAIINIARVQSVDGRLGYLLDLDVIREWAADFLPVDRAMGVVEDLRRREREVFEALITSKARDLFDA